MNRSVLCMFLGFLASLYAAEPKPNLLFILADDCTFRDLGCYGGQANTPNIDKLASEGMRFTHCFQAAPMCSPTRHNIYTGLYPVKSGAYPNHTFVKKGTRSVVQYLEPLGYRVALSGKRHIAPLSVFAFEYLGNGNNPDFAKVDEFIASSKKDEKPFCLFLCSNEPHGPWDKGDPSRYDAAKLKLPPTFVDTPETRENMTRYLAEVTYFDGQVGQALGLLEKHGLAKNTMVMVCSEQGSGFPFAKWTCYDTGLQSAMIARWPERIAADTVSDAMVEYTDILPTFIEVAGGKAEPVLDGRSFLPVLIGHEKEHKSYVFGEMTSRGIRNGPDHFGIRSVRSQRYKYVWNFTPEAEFRNVNMETDFFKSWETKAAAGDVDAAEKVRRYKQRPKEELYDVIKDPYEWHNLADDPKHAETKERLRKKLLEWMDAMGDQGQQTELAADAHQHGGKKRDGEGKKPNSSKSH